MHNNPAWALALTFQQLQATLERVAATSSESLIYLSGCTATVLLHIDGLVYTAHVGDSRTIFVGPLESFSFASSDSIPDFRPESCGDPGFQVLYATQDHKPDLPEERVRIETSGGEVKHLPRDRTQRVFYKDATYPGLAMSRALGDAVARKCGVVSEPSVGQVAVRGGGTFVVASDGLWECLSNQEVAQHLQRHRDDPPQQLAESLAAKAFKRWDKHQPRSADDVTVIVYHLVPSLTP